MKCHKFALSKQSYSERYKSVLYTILFSPTSINLVEAENVPQITVINKCFLLPFLNLVCCVTAFCR